MDLLRELISLNVDPADDSETVIAEEVRSNHYLDSGEFTDDLVSASGKIDDIKKIINTTKWKNWMRITDQNFNVDCSEAMRKMTEAFKKFEAAYHKLEDELDKAA